MNSINQTRNIYSLNPRQQRFLKRWEKLRMRSLIFYLLVYGVLREGIVALLLVKLMQYIYDPSGFIKYYLTGPFSHYILIAETFFWLGCGALIGWFKHRSFENEYRLLKQMERF